MAWYRLPLPDDTKISDLQRSVAPEASGDPFHEWMHRNGTKYDGRAVEALFARWRAEAEAKRRGSTQSL